MRTWAVLAIAAVAAAGSTAHAQESKPKDPELEKRIQKLLEQKKQDQEQAKKDDAKQGAETPEQRLDRAKLLADSEHDYEKALRLAEAVARDKKNTSEVRARAFLIAARCLAQLGRFEEMRSYQMIAAELEGPAADEAKRLLDGSVADPQLELRIAKAVEEIFSGANANADALKPSALDANQTARDLIWVGAPAVPRLTKVLADVDHLASVTGAAYLLARIGSEEAAAAVRAGVQRSDPLYRRALLRGLEPMADWRSVHASFWKGPVRAAAVSLREDRDERVRLWVLADEASLMTTSEIVAMTNDPVDAVRIAAWKALCATAERVGRDVVFDASTIPAALRRCLKEDRDAVRLAAVPAFRVGKVLLDAPTRELFVESMLDPALAGQPGDPNPDWMSALGTLENWGQGTLDSAVPIALLVRAAEAFGPAYRYESNGNPTDVGNPKTQVLQLWINASVTSPKNRSNAGWDDGQRAQVWRLLRFGYGGALRAWIKSHAHDEDVATIAEQCVVCGDVRTAVEPIEQRASTMSEDQKRATAKPLLQLLAPDVAAFDVKLSNAQRILWISRALAALEMEFADEALIKTLKVVTDNSLERRLLTRKSPEVAPRLLADLVVLPVIDGTNETQRARNDALGRMAAAKVPELPKVLAKCYEVGLETERLKPAGKELYRPRGFLWLVVRDFGTDAMVASRLVDERRAATKSRDDDKYPIAGAWEPAYSEADVRAAFEACAQGNTNDFWSDVYGAVGLLPLDGPFDPVAKVVLELSMRYAASAPPRGNNGEPPLVVRALLARRAPGWEEFVVQNALDARWRDTLLAGLPEVTPTLLDRLIAAHSSAGAEMRAKIVERLAIEKDPAVRARAVDFLKDESAVVRKAAIEPVLAIEPQRGLELVLPLAKDENSGIRYTLSERLGAVFDRRSVPVLIDLLQDPSLGVREVAKRSLDSVQYVFDQEQKWKRVLEGAGLDSANAAEALVKQAAAGQPKATRLVAIESLGTLGVAETLPVLIQFMGDGDAEIAAAAKEAVTRINRRAADGKDVNTPNSGKDGKKPAGQ